MVKLYTKDIKLQKPEETILNLFKNRLLDFKMLDMGVGGGRTTMFFANLAREYVGIDYSDKMIAACKSRFGEHSDNISFEVCDVRKMEMFQDNTFDFILFSFNGIDYIPHHDRLNAFSEIKRVGKSGGFFCFSSHNIQSIPRAFSMKYGLSLNPKSTVKNIIRWFFLNHIHNKGINIRKLQHTSHVIINDGAHNYRLQTYYIKPKVQIEQLSNYFKDIKVYSLFKGNEIQSEVELNKTTDAWLYYLCVIK